MPAADAEACLISHVVGIEFSSNLDWHMCFFWDGLIHVNLSVKLLHLPFEMFALKRSECRSTVLAYEIRSRDLFLIEQNLKIQRQRLVGPLTSGELKEKKKISSSTKTVMCSVINFFSHLLIHPFSQNHPTLFICIQIILVIVGSNILSSLIT